MVGLGVRSPNTTAPLEAWLPTIAPHASLLSFIWNLISLIRFEMVVQPVEPSKPWTAACPVQSLVQLQYLWVKVCRFIWWGYTTLIYPSCSWSCAHVYRGFKANNIDIWKGNQVFFPTYQTVQDLEVPTKSYGGFIGCCAGCHGNAPGLLNVESPRLTRHYLKISSCSTDF